MLASLPGKWRLHAAGFLVAVYSLCLGTPTVVMALAQGSIPAHCLTDEQQGAVPVHVHQDGTSHHHSNDKTGHGDHSIKCCGLFAVSAITPDITVLAAPVRVASHLPELPVESCTGQCPDRIDRPPRSLLSL